ncbi:MAG TPA: hypothetical protein VFN35_06835, partial [Ktedonobacteraceae bacterium]|nr:hypothetical protein [Ktedonobacteraceae bacterium]
PAAHQTLLNALLEADPAKRPPDMTTVIEDCERLNRRRHNLFALGKGMLLGLPFPLGDYAIGIISHRVYNPLHPATPFYSGIVLLNSFFQLITFVTLGVCALLFLVSMRKNWILRGFLLLLILTLLAMFLNIFPPVIPVPPPS